MANPFLPRIKSVTLVLPQNRMGFSYNSTPSPYGNGYSFVKPIKESKPNDGNKSPQVEPIEQIKPTGVIQEKQSNGDEERALVERSVASYGEEIEGFNNGHDYPWFGYDYGYGNGRLGGYEYECDKKIVAQTQYGYGSDGMEYCERIFGYWPCLARKNKDSNGGIQEEGNKASRGEGLQSIVSEVHWVLILGMAVKVIIGSSPVMGKRGIIMTSMMRVDGVISSACFENVKTLLADILSRF